MNSPKKRTKTESWVKFIIINILALIHIGFVLIKGKGSSKWWKLRFDSFRADTSRPNAVEDQTFYAGTWLRLLVHALKLVVEFSFAGIRVTFSSFAVYIHCRCSFIRKNMLKWFKFNLGIFLGNFFMM